MNRYINLGFASLFILTFPLSVSSAFNPLDINENGIDDSTEQQVIVDHDISLPAGEYFFKDLVINSGATLYAESDVNSTQIFKGVKINAENITLENGSSISARGRGYAFGSGPGAPGHLPADEYSGASYGGAGHARSSISTYGSAMRPEDLGSAGNYYYARGGGAIHFVVSGDFVNDGLVSADGTEISSGGSIWVEAKNLLGTGSFQANGGGSYCPNVCFGPGGGGRIAIYYYNSTYSGNATAYGGNMYGGSSQPGTVGFFDRTKNNLTVTSNWKFELVDSPFNFNEVAVKNRASVFTDNNADVSISTTSIDNFSTFYISNPQTFKLNSLYLSDNSQLYLNSPGTLFIDNINIQNYSLLNVAPQIILHIVGDNLSVDSSSKLLADGAGYPALTGPGAPPPGLSYGASYGGIGSAMPATSTYGSDVQPTDFGSGGGGYYPAGGGAIRLEFKKISNDGKISSDGYNTSSGGSIYVITDELLGNGVFSADGGSAYCPNSCYGPGGGGRIAVYYGLNNFTGVLHSSGRNSYGGNSTDGTVVFKQNNICTVNCNSNIMFFPGLMGSRLYEEQNGVENELWYSTKDSDHARLSLDNNGKSINQIYTKNDTQNNGEASETGVLDEATLGLNIYKTFISNLRDWKTQNLYVDYAMIPYDWRLSLDDIVTNGATTTDGKLSYTVQQPFDKSFILNTLRELQKTSLTGKVTIIAHSNGGLVAKALIQKLKDTNDPLYDKIDKLILVAVPQIGTPEAVLDILHGSSILGGVVMYDQRTRDLAKNMPTAYNLLPSDVYFTTVGPGYAIDKIASFQNIPALDMYTQKYGIYISNGAELKDFIEGKEGRTAPVYSDTGNIAIGNSNLYASSTLVHSVLDSWLPASTTKVIQIAGWGEETLAGIDYTIKSGKLSVNPRMVVDGDDTVVIPSALWISTSTPNIERWWVDLDKFNTISGFYAHRNILEVVDVLSLLNEYITNSVHVKSSVIFNSNTNLKASKKRLHYMLHSPLTLQVIDTNGQITGVDPITGQLKEEIPGVKYEEYGEVKYISIPEDISHTLKLNGYADGLFSLDIEKQDGNIIVESTSFEGFPSSTTTIAQIDMPAYSSIASSTLNLDFEGDGVFDLSVKSALDSMVNMPSPLTLVAEDKKVILRAPLPDLTWIITGFINGGTATSSDLVGVPACTSTATSTGAVGNYKIMCTKGTLSSNNYYLKSFAPAVLNVAYKFSGFKFEEKRDKKELIFKSGSSIPFEFNLKNYYNKKVKASTPPIFTVSQPGPKLDKDGQNYNYVDSPFSSNFKWEEEDKEYEYVWKARGLEAGYWYKVSIKLDDGNVYSIIIGLK